MSNTPRPPTLKQIGQKVGLTSAAVSLAMRGDPSIPADTRERVLKAATDLGYTPDPELGRLMSYLRKHREARVSTGLGLISLYKEPSKWTENSFLRRLHESLTNRARELGFQTEDFFFRDNRITPGRMRDILVARGIKGIVVVDGPTRVDSIELDLAPFATVTIGYGIGLPLHRVCQHQYQEIFRLLRRLRELGYKRPGLVMDAETDRRTQYHYSAAFEVARGKEHNSNIPQLLDEEITRQAFQRWVKKYKPDIVIIQGSPSAPDYMAWLAQLGLNVPEDMGIAALDIDTYAATGCSGIVQDYEHVASAAVELVASEIRIGEKGVPKIPKVLLIEGQWRDGGTTRMQAQPATVKGSRKQS
ncbi:substrate-binding domain-containing protein [Ereboglobus luteus]|uniref:substrate-binding domain-containing protein n=1 Tax=Ereboglobus luteus TaxID=1796921 RepID=UPI00126010A0|nr:substrate-binding domain-containing protein [Ereboglobus luteus]